MNRFLDNIIKVLLLTLQCLKREEKYINSLNVFPVPDGDTGSNMFMTMNEAFKGCKEKEGLDFLRCFSERVVLSAHGNSGIILSQFLSGFLNTIVDGNGDYDCFRRGFKRGVERAYGVVENPREGTILTVMRKAGEILHQCTDLKEAIKEALKKGMHTLIETQKLLPILSKAGVYDAGGAGFICFLKSLSDVFLGESMDLERISVNPKFSYVWKKFPEYSECLEVEVGLDGDVDMEGIKNRLEKYGDSILISHQKNYLKFHIHTNEPTRIINILKRIGSIESIVDRDMVKEYWDFLFGTDVAILTFSTSEDMSNLFYSLGASVIVDLPFTSKRIKYIVSKIPVDEIVIIPWNKDILFRLKRIKWGKNKRIKIIESRSLPEAIESFINFDSMISVDENVEYIQRKIKRIKTGYLTFNEETKIYSLFLDGSLFKKSDKLDELKKDLMGIFKRKDVIVILNKEREISNLKNLLMQRGINTIEIEGIKEEVIFGVRE